MIDSQVVFVLGAGASICYGFPSGRDLLLDIDDMVRELTRNPALPPEGWHQISPWELRAFADELRDSQLPSVDQFIESRPTFDRIGRLMIARTLIPRETPFTISRRRAREVAEGPRLSRQRWLEYLYGFMAAPTADAFLEKNRVSFVTFNYDRTVEQFFFTALRRSHGLAEEEALAYVRQMNIVHVYGTLGKFALELDDEQGARPFNHDPTPQAVEIAAKAIRILGDHRDGLAPEFTRAHELLSAAERVCFLGFGYHRTNVTRLLPNSVSESLARTRSGSSYIPLYRDKKVVFGTAYGLGVAERLRATEMIGLSLELSEREADCLICLQTFPLF
jgi:hypothetical protein